MNTNRDHFDPALDALLREQSTEVPPDHVDAAVLAAAHIAVANTSRRHERQLATQARRWWMPLAAAAMIGVITIGVLPLAPTTNEKRAAVVSGTPATTERTPVPRKLDGANALSRSQRAAPEVAPPRVATDATASIARMRALRDAGNEQEAIAELARFRAAFADADARLPDDLRVWANSLQRPRGQRR